ncbi:MAG: Pr6Pr family membrane protein [Lachnospiraceae bacterium]|nr:Pr6Pr family membrane protein [Lachnospiraceae bacterium]
MRKLISLIIKIVAIGSAIYGTYLSILGKNGFMSNWNALLFYTIQSNLWIAGWFVYEGIIMFKKKEYDSRAVNILKLVFTVAISLTGIVFVAILAPTLPNPYKLNNVLTHVVVPLCAVIDIFVCADRMKLKNFDFVYCVIPPIYYFIFASIGYINHWHFVGSLNYPYFFLNWGSPVGAIGFSKESPWMGPVWWVILLAALIMFMGFIFTLLVKLFSKTGKNRQ